MAMALLPRAIPATAVALTRVHLDRLNHCTFEPVSPDARAGRMATRTAGGGRRQHPSRDGRCAYQCTCSAYQHGGLPHRMPPRPLTTLHARYPGLVARRPRLLGNTNLGLSPCQQAWHGKEHHSRIGSHACLSTDIASGSNASQKRGGTGSTKQWQVTWGCSTPHTTTCS